MTAPAPSNISSPDRVDADATMMRAALTLARKGLAVFPCWPRSKHPVTKHGLKDATTDLIKVESWWRISPDYNIAVATGAVSGVFVVDVDGAEAALCKLEAEHGALPSTVEVITRRGRHLYFKMPTPDVRNSASKVAPGIDVRGTGGYVLTPPSVHPSGRRYCWSVDSASTFAAAPDWLLNMIATARASAGNGNTAIFHTPAPEWRELVKGVGEGMRDHSAARLAGHLLRHRVDPFVVLELLQAWNGQRCTPPLPAADIVRIVNSIAGKELRRRTANGG